VVETTADLKFLVYRDSQGVITHLLIENGYVKGQQ
jgi:hypothetical protein